MIDIKYFIPFVLGGHVFTSIGKCADKFGIPMEYVKHMLLSDDYPGCRFMTEDEEVSYLQTLSIMKAIDNC